MLPDRKHHDALIRNILPFQSHLCKSCWLPYSHTRNLKSVMHRRLVRMLLNIGIKLILTNQLVQFANCACN